MTLGNCQNANLNDILKSKYFLAQNKKLRSYFGVYTPHIWRKEFETSRGQEKKNAIFEWHYEWHLEMPFRKLPKCKLEMQMRMTL